MRRRRLAVVALALALAAALTAGCNKGGGGGATPTDAVKGYIDAASKKDVAAMKGYLSKKSLELMEAGAKKMNKSLDDALKEESNQSAPPNAADIKYGNEKVSGDSATVEMTAQGQTVTMPLVKEDGAWKIALDKLIEEMQKQLGG